VLRASRNKTQVGFRISQEEADALAEILAASAQEKKDSPGAYAKQALLDKLGGGPQQQLLAELTAIRQELLVLLEAQVARLKAQTDEISELRAQLALFRDEFLQALPES
jgi:hypothetical protein